MPMSELIRLVSITCLVAVCIITLLLFFLSLRRPREDAETVPRSSIVYSWLLLYPTGCGVVKTGVAGEGHESK